MNRTSTGVSGFDEVLHGGWIAGRAYVVCGGVGSGKTTLGMHFISAGLRAGESALWVSFEESQDQVLSDAQTLGIDLERLQFLDLASNADAFREMHTYDIFLPAEVERDPITQLVSDRIEQIRPQRIFIDGFDQFRHLASDAFHFKRLVQSCFRFATQQGATLFVSCNTPESDHGREIQSSADGVVALHSDVNLRRLVVTKFRGSGFHGGEHMLRLTGTGIEVFPAAA